jgi:hypothetical protein
MPAPHRITTLVLIALTLIALPSSPRPAQAAKPDPANPAPSAVTSTPEAPGEPWTEPPSPTRQQLLHDLRPSPSQGPRLLATVPEIQSIAGGIDRDPRLRRLHDNMLRRAERLLTELPLKYRADGIFYRRGAWEIIERANDLGTTYQLTGDRRYADRIRVELLALCDYPNWNQDNLKDYLNCGNLSAAAAIAYDWSKDVLTPQERKHVVDTILARSIEPSLNWYAKNVWWARSQNNWNGVCNGGIGLAALAIIDENEQTRDKCSRLLEQVLKSLPTMLRAMSPDGNPFEGINYQGYGLLNSIDFMTALPHVFGTDYGLTQYPGLKRVGDVHVYLSGVSHSFNYGDNGPNLAINPRHVFLSRISSSPLAAMCYYRATRYSGTGRDFLSYLQVPDRPPSPRQDLYIGGTEVVAMHTNLLSDDDVFVGFKAGGTCGHGDNDRGTFFIEALNETWACELGSEKYSLPDYFNTADDSKKWLYYRKAAQGQNTLVINPGPHADQKASATCPILRFESKPDHGFAIADLTPAYADAESIHRGVRLDRPSGVTTIRDEIKLRAPGEVYWSMHVQDAIFLIMHPKAVRIVKGAKTAMVRLTEGEGEFQLMDADPLPGSAAPPDQSPNSQFKKLVIHLPGVQNTVLNIAVAPVSDTGEPPTPNPQPLEKW